MKSQPTFKPLPTINAAMDSLTKITNRRRVVVQRGKSFFVCSRSAARRLKLDVVARNY